MDLNANFDERAVVHSDRQPWVASPMKGVDRRMLDRIGDEVFGVNSWLRLPPHTPLNAVSGPDGARLWVKSGHLADTPTAPNVGG